MASKNPRNKKYCPKKKAPPCGIPGIPIAAEFNPSADGYNTRQTGRYFASMLAASGEWTAHQMNELIVGLNITEQVLKHYPIYRSIARFEAAQDMLDVLQSIRKRRGITGKFGVSGDELKQMQDAVPVLDALLASVPLARFDKCEEIVFTWHAKHGTHKYKEQAA